MKQSTRSNKVKILVTPWEQKRRQPKWLDFVDRNRRAIQEWDREMGPKAALPVRFEESIDDYVWLNREQRRKEGSTQIQQLEDYKGWWQYIRTVVSVFIKRWFFGREI